MSALSSILKQRRKELGLTLSQIADAVGVTEATVQRWESGNIKSVRHEKITRLAEVLNTTPASLMGWEPEENAAGPRLPENVIPISLENGHLIPIFGRISAGLPLYAEQNIEGYTLTDLNGGAEYFALRVKGDSMNAIRIQEGDLLIVRRQEEVENGEIAIVMVGDEDATVKRFYATNDTVTLMPQSTNPENTPQMYDIKKTPVRVLGKVVKVEFSVS